MLSKKFRLALSLTLALSTLTPTTVLADELSSGVISVNEVSLSKDNKSTEVKGDKGLYYVYNNLLNSNVIIYDKDTYDKNSTKIDMSEMLDRDLVLFTSNFKIEDLYFPLNQVSSFICNNSKQYITFKGKANNQHRFTLEFKDTKLYFHYRQMLLNACDTNVTKYRELDEVLEDFEIIDISKRGKSLATQSVTAFSVDTSQLILRTRCKIKVTGNQLCKTMSLERNSSDTDRYFSTLNNLIDSSYKGSKIINIDNSNQPVISDCDYVWDWTVIPVDTKGRNLFTSDDMTNLCLRVSYNEGDSANSTSKLGSLDYIRICTGKALASNKSYLDPSTQHKTHRLKLLRILVYSILGAIQIKLISTLLKSRKKGKHV